MNQKAIAEIIRLKIIRAKEFAIVHVPERIQHALDIIYAHFNHQNRGSMLPISNSSRSLQIILKMPPQIYLRYFLPGAKSALQAQWLINLNLILLQQMINNPRLFQNFIMIFNNQMKFLFVIGEWCIHLEIVHNEFMIETDVCVPGKFGYQGERFVLVSDVLGRHFDYCYDFFVPDLLQHVSEGKALDILYNSGLINQKTNNFILAQSRRDLRIFLCSQ